MVQHGTGGLTRAPCSRCCGGGAAGCWQRDQSSSGRQPGILPRVRAQGRGRPESQVTPSVLRPAPCQMLTTSHGGSHLHRPSAETGLHAGKKSARERSACLITHPAGCWQAATRRLRPCTAVQARGLHPGHALTGCTHQRAPPPQQPSTGTLQHPSCAPAGHLRWLCRHLMAGHH